MQCFTELTPPSAVTHALCLPFLSPGSNSLIVVRTSLLQVFSLKTISRELDTRPQDSTGANCEGVADRRILENEHIVQSFLDAGAGVQNADRLDLTKLVLVAEYALSGTVLSLARIKIQQSKTGAEALLIASQEAKLSLVEWDPSRHGLSTISIHYYERDDLQRNPWTFGPHKCLNYLTADPRSRCAVLKFGSRDLAILPFRQAGDDLIMNDYDLDIDGERSRQPVPHLSNGEGPATQVPYGPSFVLPITALDPTLIHPVHLAFLYEYREPTFGVLSSSTSTSTSILDLRRDNVAYTVFTLDLEQRASTTILTVSALPYDLYKIIPLPPPVGGSLLLGLNELVHVDQAGKTNGVAVNAFARECTSFSMADQSALAMKLERCTIELMDSRSGDMLIILSTGELAVASFKLDGRSVSGLLIRKVPVGHGGHIVQGAVSCAASLTDGRIFFGGEDGDSVVLGWHRKSEQATKQRRQSSLLPDAPAGEVLDEDETEDYDDDLYAAADSEPRKATDVLSTKSSSPNSTGTGDYAFMIHDSLFNLAPTSDFAFGYPSSTFTLGNDGNSGRPEDRLEMVVATGRARAGGITIINRELSPKPFAHFELARVQGIWSVRAKPPVAKGIPSQSTGRTATQLEDSYAMDQEYDRFMIISKSDGDNQEESAIYGLTKTAFEELKDTDFEPTAGATIDVGTLCNGTRVVQVLREEIRSYDSNLGLAQIFPLTDEMTDTEPQIVNTSFADPYLLLFRKDQSVLLLKSDESGDLEDVEASDYLGSTKWISGCVYVDRVGALAPRPQTGSRLGEKAEIRMILLNAEGNLHIFTLPDLVRPVYVTGALASLPSILEAHSIAKRASTQAEIRDVLVADLGDQVAKSPYVILRTFSGEIILYEPFHDMSESVSSPQPSVLRFLKVTGPHLSRATTSWAREQFDEANENRAGPLRVFPDIDGYSTVFISGQMPCFLLKSATSQPMMMRLGEKAVVGMSGFHTRECERGWVYFDVEGKIQSAQFPSNITIMEPGWPVRKVTLGEEVQALSYHNPTETYVLGVIAKNSFELPRDDELHRNWARENISLTPEVDQSTLKLLSPINWTIIDSYALQPNEIVLCIETLSLEISENTHARRHLIVVGTSNSVVADQPSRGTIYIFDIISVVPEPDRPETNRGLKLISREEVKGAVTALSEVGTQGFLLAAQGQKCMVRGLKEDGSLLPLAFMDMMCYVSVARCLPGTGICLMGDALKGVWFVGYLEEPYKMTLFGKSTGRLEVMGADFLPNGEQLYIVVADAGSNIHILQFDPEHPKSLSGTHLLPLRSFHTGQFPSKMTRIPSSFSQARDQILLTSSTGSISLLTLLLESSYRRLLSVQSQLYSTLEHPCGLNPKSYRLGSMGTDGFAERGVLDGRLLGRWTELEMSKRADILSRIGTDEEELREDFRAVGIGGADEVLSYL